MKIINHAFITTVSVAVFLASGCSSSGTAVDIPENTTNSDLIVTGNPSSEQSDTTPTNSDEIAMPVESDSQLMLNSVQPETAPTFGDEVTVPVENESDFILNNVGYQLIEQLAGYSLTLTGQQIVAISEVAINTASDSVELDGVDLTVVVQDEPDTVPFQRIQYSCEQGGELVVRKAAFIQGSASSSHTVDHTEYIFDQCGLATGGQQTLSGTMRMIEELTFDVTANTVDRSFLWTNFDWQKPDNASLVIDAEIKLRNSEAITSMSSRGVKISRYEIYANEELQEAVYDGDFFLSTQVSNDSDVQEYSLNTNGRVIDSSAVPVQITTDPIMTRTLVSEGINVVSVPFNGRITMLADDSSALILEANAMSENNTLQVDSTYTDSHGNVTTLNGQNFLDLTILAF